MPIRIYALAKELKIDSKELVDVCSRAGITGKGSALASLTDDEVTRIRGYLAGGNKGPSRPAAPPPSDAEKTAGPAPPAPEPPPVGSTSGSAPQPISRDDYIAPGGVSRKPPVLGRKKSDETTEGDGKSNTAETPKREDKPKQRQPVIKLAAMPEAKTPAHKAKTDGPAPQKPIMSLPPEALRSARASGSNAPLREFTKQHEKKREAGKRPAGRERPTGTPASTDSAAREKSSVKDRRKSRTGKGGKEEGLAGMASARAARQQTRKRRTGRRGDEDDSEPRRRARRLSRRGGTNTAAPRKGAVTLELPCTVRSFSEATGVPSAQIQRTLMGLGTMATITATLDPELAELLAAELGVDVEFRQEASLEDTLLSSLEELPDDEASLELRAPVVTFLGHVDHGKTSLLDRLIGIDVVSGEAGGITQHIRAYRIEKDGRGIAFVDTPGHEAFTEMRARGANVTDIAVLVVAADDGVMPQTIEAISHAKAAEVPIIVALNKCDLPGVDINRVMQELSQHELLPTEWGGDVEVVKTSAISGEGMDDLLETILLTAELHEYQANPDRPAVGVCLEAQQEGTRGVVAKMIIKNGTLRVGDVLVCGSAFGRAKAMYDPLHPKTQLESAGPSTPCNLTGLDEAPNAGDTFYVVPEISQAREIAEQRMHRNREKSLSGRTVRVSFEEFQKRLEEGSLNSTQEMVSLNLILRADVRGSIEAIENEMNKLEHPEVGVHFLQKSVGGVTVADVHLADASNAVIVGFNVIPDEAARTLAEERGVEIRRYDIIYKVTEDVKALLEGKLQPERRTADLGRALVQRVFSISRVGTVAGCRVLAGAIERGCRIRVNREGRGIGDYALDSLRREKDDTKQVREGYECGIRLAGFNDVKEGDILEAYKIEEVSRTL